MDIASDRSDIVQTLGPFKACIYGLPVGVTLATRLGHFIEVFRIPRTELAEATGIASKTINRWESGEEDARDSSLSKLEAGVKRLLRDSRFTAAEAHDVAEWLA